MSDLHHVEQQARFEAVRVAQRIAEEANAHTHPPAFAGTCASIALQTILCSLLLDHYEPGSAEGEAELRKFYEGVVRDAVERWHRPDLKQKRWIRP